MQCLMCLLSQASFAYLQPWEKPQPFLHFISFSVANLWYVFILLSSFFRAYVTAAKHSSNSINVVTIFSNCKSGHMGWQIPVCLRKQWDGIFEVQWYRHHSLKHRHVQIWSIWECLLELLFVTGWSASLPQLFFAPFEILLFSIAEISGRTRPVLTPIKPRWVLVVHCFPVL